MGLPLKHAPRSKATSQTRTTVSSSAFTSRVKALIKGSKEVKTASSASTEVTVSTGVVPTYFDFPSIGVGPEINERIGNEINVERIEMKVLYHNNGTSQNSRPIAREVLMLVAAGRYITDGEITANIFEGAIDTTLAGTAQDLLRLLNTDGIRILSDRLVKMGPLGVDSAAEVIKYTQLSKRMNKKLLYRDSGTAQPVSDRYVLCIIPVDPANDGAIHSFEVSTNLRFHYTD